MNNKGLFCSTVILLVTLSFQGCAQLGTQVSKVKSALPSKKKNENMLAAGRQYESKKEWLAAREQYERYLKKDPKSVKACHRLGIVCTRLGDSVAATRYFTQARQLDPTNSEVLNDFGYALYQRGQYQAAEKILAGALQNDAKNTRILNNLALSVGHQGRFKESYTMFRSIMSPAEAHANLAYIHTQRGEGDLALKEYDLALTADPTLETAGLAAAELAEMKNLYLAQKSETNQEQQLAVNKPAPAKPAPQPAKPQLKPTVKPETQPVVEVAQQEETEEPVFNPFLNNPQPEVKQQLVSQTDAKLESLKKSLQAETTEPTFRRPVAPVAPVQTKPIIQVKKEEPAVEALEIDSFNSIEELSVEEKPAIIRISNESASDELEIGETMFRSPQELLEN